MTEWERGFRAGYISAVLDSAKLLIRRARGLMGIRNTDDDLAGPLIDAGIDVVKLHNQVNQPTDGRIH